MPRWTPETRRHQAERIRALCPWTKSTGPRTQEGKAKSARNAWKGGVRAIAAHYSCILRSMETVTKKVFSSFCQKPKYGRKRAPRSQRGLSSGVWPSAINRSALFSSFCQAPGFSVATDVPDVGMSFGSGTSLPISGPSVKISGFS